MSRLILGINSAHADSSVALVGETGLLAAVAEERLNRRKHCAGFPSLAVREVLDIAGASPSDLTDIAVARDPRANLAAKLAFVARYPRAGIPRAFARARVHREVAEARQDVADALGTSAGSLRADFHHVEHHLAHIASSFYNSPFDRATGVSVDGAGDFASHMLARCEGRDVWVSRRTLWPHSLGVFYTALCQFIGFERFGEEYKVMGLSAYGVNQFAPEMRDIARWDPIRGIRLNLRYFQHHQIGLNFEHIEDDEVSIPQLWSPAMVSTFGPPRRRGEPLGDRERDIAASLQARFEELYLQLIEQGVRTTGNHDVVLAGGSSLNSVANGRMITERMVDGAYFHPAPADDGTAAGAALYVLHSHHRVHRTRELRSAYLGREYDEPAIERALVQAELSPNRLERDDLIARAADALAAGKIVGWFQGREEWGPRALGNRSILCHPGWPGMKDTLNARIKHREPFRPFAPVVLAEKLGTCFRGDHEVHFMIVVFQVRPEWKERLSAITHEDGTGRVQTVDREQNELYYDLISAFEQRTGTPVLLNTSFNENEPIVHTPDQAIDCFLRTRMDALGIGPFWIEKPAPGDDG
ncbi:MAG: carbamoyltransferase [Deltaproteobacteria bacterium]|jgi:carbamoyltransferase|nr:carbamoyltransferase [Deltaproteobacteria bacterium]MBW2536798.1 carbamoyltransferase [Deltaproteobacteria bacterium]